MNLLANLLRNKHTTGAGAIYIIALLLGEIAAIWFPGKKQQIDASLEVIKGAAVTYGLVMAGDGNQSAKAHEETKQMVNNLQSQINQVKSDTAIQTKQ